MTNQTPELEAKLSRDSGLLTTQEAADLIDVQYFAAETRRRGRRRRRMGGRIRLRWHGRSRVADYKNGVAARDLTLKIRLT